MNHQLAKHPRLGGRGGRFQFWCKRCEWALPIGIVEGLPNSMKCQNCGDRLMVSQTNIMGEEREWLARPFRPRARDKRSRTSLGKRFGRWTVVSAPRRRIVRPGQDFAIPDGLVYSTGEVKAVCACGRAAWKKITALKKSRHTGCGKCSSGTVNGDA